MSRPVSGQSCDGRLSHMVIGIKVARQLSSSTAVLGCEVFVFGLCGCIDDVVAAV